MFLAWCMFGNNCFTTHEVHSFLFLKQQYVRRPMSIFQDDNTKIHQAQFVKDWPPQSPDLKPIESHWDVLELMLHCLSKKKLHNLIFC